MASAIPTPVVYVVDDDTDILGSLRFLLETDGFDVQTFRSAAALLNWKIAARSTAS
jgi:two-component system, LuxR family, response regulator FixJ